MDAVLEDAKETSGTNSASKTDLGIIYLKIANKNSQFTTSLVYIRKITKLYVYDLSSENTISVCMI
jgi:hypothetical protein